MNKKLLLFLLVCCSQAFASSKKYEDVEQDAFLNHGAQRRFGDSDEDQRRLNLWKNYERADACRLANLTRSEKREEFEIHQEVQRQLYLKNKEVKLKEPLRLKELPEQTALKKLVVFNCCDWIAKVIGFKKN